MNFNNGYELLYNYMRILGSAGGIARCKELLARGFNRDGRTRWQAEHMAITLADAIQMAEKAIA